MLTHKGMLKAIKILRNEPRYIHSDYVGHGPWKNCYCALGAISKATFGDVGSILDVTSRLNSDRRGPIGDIFDTLSNPHAKVNRQQAIAMVRKLDKLLFAKGNK
jgi:hypothetical protein